MSPVISFLTNDCSSFVVDGTLGVGSSSNGSGTKQGKDEGAYAEGDAKVSNDTFLSRK
jgi:hypothetical protein